MYGIMRVEKRKRQALYGLEAEANRTKQTHEKGLDFIKSEIDWNKTDENLRLVTTHGWHEAVKRLCAREGARLRADSVEVIDALYTASPEFFKTLSPEQTRQFFEDCLDYHIRAYCHGDARLVLNAVVHLDETTPHMQVASVPLVERSDGTLKLSAKELCGGPSDYRRRQDEYFAEVTSKYGLDRGERSDPHERKQHLDVQSYKLKAREQELEAKQASIKDANNALKAHQAAIQAHRDASRPEDPLKPIKRKEARTGLFGASDGEVTYSERDAQRLEAALRYAEGSQHMERAVERMGSFINELAAGPQVMAAQSKLVDRERSRADRYQRFYEDACAKADKYDRLVSAYPDEVAQLEHRLMQDRQRMPELQKPLDR